MQVNILISVVYSYLWSNSTEIDVELVSVIEQERQESYGLTGKESLSVVFSSNMRLMRDKTDVFDKDTQIVKGEKSKVIARKKENHAIRGVQVSHDSRAQKRSALSVLHSDASFL